MDPELYHCLVMPLRGLVAIKVSSFSFLSSCLFVCWVFVWKEKVFLYKLRLNLFFSWWMSKGSPSFLYWSFYKVKTKFNQLTFLTYVFEIMCICNTTVYYIRFSQLLSCYQNWWEHLILKLLLDQISSYWRMSRETHINQGFILSLLLLVVQPEEEDVKCVHYDKKRSYIFWILTYFCVVLGFCLTDKNSTHQRRQSFDDYVDEVFKIRSY